MTTKRTVVLYRYKDGALIEGARVPATPGRDVHGAKLTPDGRLLILGEIVPRKGSWIRTVRLSDGGTAGEVKLLPVNHTSFALRSLFSRLFQILPQFPSSNPPSPSGRYVAVGSGVGEVILLSVRPLAELMRADAHGFTVTGLAVHEDLRTGDVSILSCALDRSLAATSLAAQRDKAPPSMGTWVALALLYIAAAVIWELFF